MVISGAASNTCNRFICLGRCPSFIGRTSAHSSSERRVCCAGSTDSCLLLLLLLSLVVSGDTCAVIRRQAYHVIWEEDPDGCCLLLEVVQVLLEVSHRPVHLILTVTITWCNRNAVHISAAVPAKLHLQLIECHMQYWSCHTGQCSRCKTGTPLHTGPMLYCSVRLSCCRCQLCMRVGQLCNLLCCLPWCKHIGTVAAGGGCTLCCCQACCRELHFQQFMPIC